MDQITQQLIEANLKAQINGVDLLPICLFGKPGVGKTSTVASIAKEIGAKLYAVSIPSKDISYFGGWNNLSPYHCILLFDENKQMIK